MNQCEKVEREPRWHDGGRYRCDLPAGHVDRCSAWSRSASGRHALTNPVHPKDSTMRFDGPRALGQDGEEE